MFETLKRLFTSAPFLSQPYLSLPYVLEVNASEIVVGIVVSQFQGLKVLMHPVAFFSSKRSPVEENYDIGD